VCENIKDGAEKGVGTTEGCEALQLKLLVIKDSRKKTR
jgi:hypothetical protein